MDEKNEFELFISKGSGNIAKELDRQRSNPDNAYIQSEGFFYGFNDLDKSDYLDSGCFVERYKEWCDK